MKKTLLLASTLGLMTFAHAQQKTTSDIGQVITSSQETSTHLLNDEDEDQNILWEQAVSTAENKYSIVSTYYTQSGWGMYSADDFITENKITINSILFYGSQSNDDAQDQIEKVNLYFYTDNDGVPTGSPEEQGTELAKYSFDYADLVVEPGAEYYMGNKIYYLDILEALGEGIELEAGHYWLSIVYDIDMDSSNFEDRFVWSDSEGIVLNEPKVIVSELGITEWTDTSETGFPVESFAFSLYGDTEILSTSSFELDQLKVYPNPTADVFYIGSTQIGEIQSIHAFNILGKSFELNYKNGRVDVTHLTEGTYIIQIETLQGTVNRKLIKN